MFIQAALPVNDEAHFATVKASLETLFATGNVTGFLKRVHQSKLRVRDYEGLLQRGTVGVIHCRGVQGSGRW